MADYIIKQNKNKTWSLYDKYDRPTGEYDTEEIAKGVLEAYETNLDYQEDIEPVLKRMKLDYILHGVKKPYPKVLLSSDRDFGLSNEVAIITPRDNYLVFLHEEGHIYLDDIDFKANSQYELEKEAWEYAYKKHVKDCGYIYTDEFNYAVEALSTYGSLKDSIRFFEHLRKKYPAPLINKE